METKDPDASETVREHVRKVMAQLSIRIGGQQTPARGSPHKAVEVDRDDDSARSVHDPKRPT